MKDNHTLPTDEGLQGNEKMETAIAALQQEATEEEVKVWIESKGYHLGNIMNATRLALVGEGKGPHIFDITEALGKEESIRRIQRAIDKLSIDN
jgi:glutamyl/glutaminyl-tRNA synthetase